jgi:hypothetical protein
MSIGTSTLSISVSDDIEFDSTVNMNKLGSSNNSNIQAFTIAHTLTFQSDLSKNTSNRVTVKFVRLIRRQKEILILKFQIEKMLYLFCSNSNIKKWLNYILAP